MGCRYKATNHITQDIDLSSNVFVAPYMQAPGTLKEIENIVMKEMKTKFKNRVVLKMIRYWFAKYRMGLGV